MRVSSRDLLERLGYEYLHRVYRGSEPDYSSYRFRDILPVFGKHPLGDKYLYKHQYMGLSILRRGSNLILKSGTGSGKTEVWILYALERIMEDRGYRVLVMYPTLALANDQIRRIKTYTGLINASSLQIDSVRRDEYIATIGRRGLRERIASSNIIVSNPAFILLDVKKMLLRQTSALLYPIYKHLNMIVIDEIDFYNPRSLALLLALLKILSEISDVKPQIVVLTATLSNPDDLGGYLREITGRDYGVVEGKPFNVENHLYVILGKNIDNLWRKLGEYRGMIEGLSDQLVREELLKAIESIEYFRKNLYRILSITQAVGIDLPSPGLDPSEIISGYLDDEYVTIVFTNSISSAEEIVRSIKHRYGEDAPIASHHHLIPKKRREEIEEGARRGAIKVIVSPRTLSQGIDIGTVARIVHLGLPDDVREYYQREGRKGRRRELGFSETVIIPYSRWDRELLSRGLDVFNKWLELGIEKTIINPNNLYIYLFTGLAKILSPWYRRKLEDREEETLKRVGVLTDGDINYGLAKWIYERVNFYEFAPPYGIKRYLLRGDEKIPLEPISHCDLVEKFQPGNIDYGEGAIVTHLDTGRSTRYVRAVYEKPIGEINFYSDDAFAVALEEYRYIKYNWGEKPNIIRDILSGRLSSEELCIVYSPWNGFGKYKKIPERCIWRLRSEKPRIASHGGKLIVYYDRREIYVPKPTAGEYQDYTYGYLYSVDPSENSDLLRLGLATLMIILRRVYGLAFETIMYDVFKLGEYKYFSLHEPEAAGIIDGIDWLDVRRRVREYVFDDLDPILLSEIDDIAYSILVSYDFNWELVREIMIRIIDYILARSRIKVLFMGREYMVPKPSPALKLLSISIIAEILGGEAVPQVLVGLDIYDGGEHYTATALYPPIPYIKPPEEIRRIEEIANDRVFYEDYKLIVADRDRFLEQLKLGNIRKLGVIVGDNSRVINLSELIKERIGNVSFEEIILGYTGEFKGIDPSMVREALKRVEEKRSIGGWERRTITSYLRSMSEKQYLTYLILSNLA